MGWTNSQKGLFVRSCRSAGIDDGNRRLILLQCGQRSIHEGRPTSKSPKLTQGDFDHCMAVVESASGGRIKVGGLRGDGFAAGRFADAAGNALRRLRYVARQRVAEFVDAGLLENDQDALSSWIRNRVTAGRTGDFDELTRKEIEDLMYGLSAHARRHGQRVE